MSVLRHLVALFRRGRLDDELRDELAQHLAWKAERLVAEGLPEAEARRRAALEVGNVSRLREDARAIWGFPRLDSIVQDLSYGARQMRRAPLFSAIAVLSLAIGIGAGAAVFSLADAMVLRKLPVIDPDRLVLLKWSSGPVYPFSSLDGTGEQSAAGLASTSFSKSAMEQMLGATNQVDLFGFADLDEVNASANGVAEVATAHAVSGNYFDVLGVVPAAGRLLGAGDDRLDAPAAVVISERFWQRRFARSADAVGHPLAINGVSFTVAGVAPAGFRGTGQVLDSPDLFVPLTSRGRLVRGEDHEDDPNFWWVLLMGRLRPGASPSQVQPALDVVLKRTVAAAKPELTAKDLPALQVSSGARGQTERRDHLREPLRTMGIVVAIVLLVACANVANLLLARGHARGRELSVRTAIGAPRRRIVRQLFTEGALLAAAGAVLGLLTAQWISAALLPALVDRPGEPAVAALNWRLVAFVAVLAGACAIFFALVPAIRATAGTLAAGLRDASTRGAAARRGRLAGSLVVLQLALSMVLVVGAALLARSLSNLDRVALGFDAHNVLTFQANPTLNGYPPDRVRALNGQILDALRAAPGVTAATFTSHALLARSAAIGVAVREGEAAPREGSADTHAFMKEHTAWRLVTGPGFFPTMRTPIVRGRAFDERDSATSQHVMVVNRRLAQELFKTDDVIGRRLRLGLNSTATVYEIVGLCADARYSSVRDDMPPTAYLAAAQQPVGTVTFEVRTSGSAEAAAPLARDIVRRIDDQVPLVNVKTLSAQVADSLSQERLFARLAVLLGSVALALSAIGLYGLLAYGVSQRVPEIGIRMALGAERRAVSWMILRQSLRLAATGLVAGAAGALAGTGVIASMLYQLPPRDPLTIAGAAGVMLAACLLAAYLPARRAARVDPLVALRAN